jgi:4-amino-4-deoxy-L-arabinose transferase-like glycosyltransferase
MNPPSARAERTVARSQPLFTKYARCWVPLVTVAVWGLFMPTVVARTRSAASDQLMYAEAAESLVAGQGLKYRGIYGLEQPAWLPMHNWPPGWAVLIALPHSLGISTSTSAVAWNLLFGAAGVVLVSWICLRSFPPEIALAITLAVVCMPVYLINSVLGTTDLPFVVVVLASLACLVRGLEDDARIAWLMAAGVLAGVSYSFRYVGVTLMMASMLPFAMFAWKHGITKAAKAVVVWGCAVAVCVLPIVAYNLSATGRIIPYDWAANQDSHFEVIRDTLIVLVQDITTSKQVALAIVDKYSLAVVGTIAAGLLLWQLRTYSLASIWSTLQRQQLLVVVLLFAGLYFASLLSARMKYHLTDGTHGVWDRYLLPLHAAIWIMVALGTWTLLQRIGLPVVWRRALVVVGLCSMVALQWGAMQRRLASMPPQVDSLAEWLGPEAADYLKANVDDDQVVLSCRADLLRRLGKINARYFSPAQFERTILRGPTRAEMNAAGESGYLWGVVIEDPAAARDGFYGDWVQQLATHPALFPELEPVSAAGSTTIFKFVGQRHANGQDAGSR